MTQAKSLLNRFARCEAGVSTIEYALLASLIAVVCVTALMAVGTNLSALYLDVCRAVPGSANC